MLTTHGGRSRTTRPLLQRQPDFGQRGGEATTRVTCSPTRGREPRRLVLQNLRRAQVSCHWRFAQLTGCSLNRGQKFVGCRAGHFRVREGIGLSDQTFFHSASAASWDVTFFNCTREPQNFPSGRSFSSKIHCPNQCPSIVRS